MLEGEVLEIAARELGNGQPAKLTEKQQSVLLKGCRVEDIYVHGPDGKPAKRDYYSVRRLVKIISGEVEKLKERRGS